MATFPGGVKSFTGKNPGDSILDTHIDDLQDEVTAIEDGYLNGSARLNASNSTLATLSVTGASTFDVRPVTPPPHAAKVFLDSTVTIGSSVASTVAWLAQEFLTNSSMHSTTTNPARLTPQSTGLYQFTAQLGFSINSTTGRQVDIFDSSAALIASGVHGSYADGATFLSVTGYKRYDVLGGYAVVRAAVGAGVSTLSLSSGSGGSWFAMVKL